MRYAIRSLAVLALVTGCAPLDDEASLDLALSSWDEEAIRNGSETKAFPSVGILFDAAGDRSCTATLIGRDTVLTAAHCVKGSPASALSFTLARGPVFLSSDLHRASAVRVHASYREGVSGRVDEVGEPSLQMSHVGADLAVIKLVDRFGSVPRYALDGNGVDSGDLVRIVGYGQDESGDSGEKQVGRMRVRGSADGPKSDDAGYDDSLISLVPTAADQNACPGDSGGPVLSTQPDGQLRIAGVASFIVFDIGTSASAVCQKANGSYYTDVGRFSSWIKNARTALSPPGSCVRKDDARFATLGGGCRDKPSAKVWSKPRGAHTRAKALELCQNLVEGGRSDWRLPTKGQLRAVAQRGAKRYLNGVESAFYWTKTLAADGRGVSVRLGDGVARSTAKGSSRRVVCVRG